MAVSHFHASHWLGQAAAGASINTPTLAVADQGDGTGATATVSGATAGTTCTIWTGQFSGDTGSMTWTNSGSRVGNGAVDLSLSTGHYFAYCASTDGTNDATSSLVYFVVTGTTESIYYQILDAVQTKVQSLSLADIAGGDVLLKRVPLIRVLTEAGISLPAVLVTPTREQMPAFDGVNVRDDVTYGVLVTAIDADNQVLDFDTAAKKYTLWREQIAKAFRSQRLSGVDEVMSCTAEPLDWIDGPRWMANYYSTGVHLRFTARETRGT